MARSRRLSSSNAVPAGRVGLLALVVALALVAAPSALEATTSGAAITNGTVALGVNDIGDLNYTCDPTVDDSCPANPSREQFGVRYLPTGSDATAQGCACEGWGVGDATSGLAGWANESEANRGKNVTLDSFVANASSAVSTVTVSDPQIPGYQLQVVHDYHPSAATPNLYEATVTVKNTGANAITNLQYRRVMDWDIEPTPFHEWVTIQNPGNSPELLFDSDNGFASADPLQGPSSIDSAAACGVGYTGICTFSDLGKGGTYPNVTVPDDHGSLFDFQFGALAPGASTSFRIFYGGASSETAILDALEAVGAEVYSIGEDNCPEPGRAAICTDVPPNAGVEQGLPNAFGFGFVTTSADLSIAKTGSPDPVVDGADLTYTLSVRNAGPDTAAAVKVTDPLPPGVTFVSASTTAGSCEGPTTVTCDLGPLANGSEATITIVVETTAPGLLSNTATVSSASADPVPADNSSTATTTVTPSADLSVAKTDSPDPVILGGNLTYTIVASNAGPDAANATVQDTLPGGVTLVSAGSCSGTATLTCDLGTLAPGTSATATVVVTPTAAGPLSNTATVSSTDGSDPDPSNNSATATTTVIASADLSITKTASPEPATVGSSLTYTITATNAGPSTADAVTVSDPLPAAVTFVSASASAGSCSGGGVVTCELGSLAAGASATVTIVVTPTAAGPLSNTATVSSTTADPNLENDSATATTTVNPGSSGPPSCAGVTADPSSLWPPNHKLVLVTLTAGSTADGGPVSIVVTGVTQDEPAGAGGPDWMLGAASDTVWLRAEREGSDERGRTYTVAFTLTDTAGASCSGTVPVRVAHDMGH